MQNLCDLYKLYVLGWSQQQQFGKSQGATGFLEHVSLFINIFTEEKCQKRQLETTPCLCFSTNMSLCFLYSFWLTEVTKCTFVCVHLSNFCQPPSLSAHCWSISELVAGEYTVDKESVISWPVVQTRATRGQIISWIWAQLIAAVDIPDSLLPQGFHLLSHQEQNCG